MKKFFLIQTMLLVFTLLFFSKAYAVGTLDVSYLGGSSFSFSNFSSPTPSDLGLSCGVDGYSYISGGPGNAYGGNFHICDETGGTLAPEVYLPDGYYEIAWIANNGLDVWQSPFFYVSGMPNPSITPTSTPTPTPTPTPTTLTPTSDTWIKKDYPNENEGSSPFMRLKETGKNRALVKFNESQIQSAVGSSTNYTAKLRFTITDNGNNWSSNGRPITIHRLTTDWSEGNGYISGNTPSDRGTGNGATWNCAVDSNIHNQQTDCTASWDMLTSYPFITTPTDTKTITSSQSGVVEFDVTSDIQSFLSGTPNYGWIVKKQDETQSGLVSFGTKESGSTPQLIITPL